MTIDGAVKLRSGRKLAGHGSAVVGVAFSPDCKRLISAGDQSARVWDVESGDLVGAIKIATKATAMAVFPGGEKLALASLDRVVRLWGGNQSDPQGQLGPLNADIVSMAISPDGKLLALGMGTELQVWDVSGVPRKAYTYPRPQDHVAGVAFSPDGQALAWVNFHGELHVVETTEWRSIADSAPNSGEKPDEFSSVTFTSDGKTVLHGGRMEPGWGILKRWEFTRPGETPRTILTEKGDVRAMALLPGDRNLLYGGESGGPLRLMDLQEIRPGPAAKIGQTALMRLALSPDGRLVAGGLENGEIQLWQVVPDADR